VSVGQYDLPVGNDVSVEIICKDQGKPILADAVLFVPEE